MKVVIAVDKNPTPGELTKLEEAQTLLRNYGLTVELIGTRPNDR